MSEYTGPWAWRMRDFKGGPGPWHVSERQRPAIASGDNIEVIVVPEMAEEIERLKAENIRAIAAFAEKCATLEAQRDALVEAIEPFAHEFGYSSRTKHNESYCDRVDALRAAIAKATP